MSVYSDEPDPPVYYKVVETYDAVRYTDVSQAQWFIDRIEWAFGGRANARLEGTQVRWFGYYYLNLGDWLYQGQQRVTDEQMRNSDLRVITEPFPDESTESSTPPSGGA